MVRFFNFDHTELLCTLNHPKETLIRHKLCSVVSFFDYNEFNKRGKASRLVTDAQMQWQVVTLKRTYATIIFFWAGSTVSGTIYFVNPLVISRLGNIGILLCIVIAILNSYSKMLPFVTTTFSHSHTSRKHSQPKLLHWTWLDTERQYQVHCGTNIGCLLSAVCCCARCNTSRRNFATLPC